MKKDKFPGKKSMEKSFSDIQKIMNSTKFNSPQEAQAFMSGLTGKIAPEYEGPQTPAEQAQELIYEADEKSNRKDRILLAYKALHIYPDCADAYNMLAMDEARTDGEVLDMYQKGEAAGRRALGEEFIRDNKGELWMHLEARPYMRAMHGVAEELWLSCKSDGAIAKCREMLELNKGDNQGIRYLLSSYLAEEKRYAELDALMNTGEYKDDCGIEWYYDRPLAEFHLRGDSERARKLVYEAVKRNTYVITYMSGAVKIPKDTPDTYSRGSVEEAIIYVHFHMGAWLASREAFTWFMETVNSMLEKHGPEFEAGLKGMSGPVKAAKKPGRNEPCPCGSGKKYKKCCGEVQK